MPTLGGVISDPIGWLQHTWPWLVILSLAAYLLWRFTRPVLHRVVWGALRVHGHAVGGALPDDELRKRADTIEQLLASLVRFAIILGIVFAILGFFDLWSAVAGLGLLGAALTVAGQPIVLDYLMGTLILLEGQYYTGDTIAAAGVEGLVEEVGLRRTVKIGRAHV